jgi:hypothetical protein
VAAPRKASINATQNFIDIRGLRNVSRTLSSLPPFLVDQNNLNLREGGVVRVTATVPVSISGLISIGVEGREVDLLNIGSTAITFLNESGLSDAGNRIFTGAGGPVSVQPNSMLSLVYDTDISRWRVRSALGGSLVGTDVSYLFYADQLDNPVNSDWAVNALAPAVADSLNPGLTVRRFDDTVEEGVGFIVTVQPSAMNLTISLKSRAQTAPGVPSAVVPRLYRRIIGDNVAVGAWSAGLDLTALAIPMNTNFQYDSQVISLASLGIAAGDLVQFELTRSVGAGGDTLIGDWDPTEVGITLS